LPRGDLLVASRGMVCYDSNRKLGKLRNLARTAVPASNRLTTYLPGCAKRAAGDPGTSMP
jgi:hypothetical protein